MIILTLTTDGPAFRPLLFTGRFILGIGVGWTSVSGGVSEGHACMCVCACKHSGYSLRQVAIQLTIVANIIPK